MYSRKAWGGDQDPFILVTIEKGEIKNPESDHLVSLVIFEWKDEDLIGRYPEGDHEKACPQCSSAFYFVIFKC